jgi:hypothetical protein
VFSTLSRIDSRSSGDVVRGSTISQEMPSPSSWAAAAWAINTMRPSATIVTSSPSRTKLASAKGMA